MADVSGNLKDWSTTAASNSPSGATSIGTGLDDNLRELQKVVRQDLAHKGADIASATTTDVGAVVGLMHDITGTTTITGLGTVSAGIWKILKFEGAVPLIHNATSLILPGGANITTADGDVAIMFSEGSGNWRCLSYQRAAGRSSFGITLGTEQASTSGTSIDFTGIPTGTKKIKIGLVGVSTNGSSNLLIQLGDAGGVEATGYSAFSGNLGVSNSNYTTGFGVELTAAAATVRHGTIELLLENASTFTWVASGVVSQSNAAAGCVLSGSKSLSAELDRVRITTVNGTDAFDAGAINIQYE
jgi:hypothetical protein